VVVLRDDGAAVVAHRLDMIAGPVRTDPRDRQRDGAVVVDEDDADCDGR
jgi:hypothetical protein